MDVRFIAGRIGPIGRTDRVHVHLSPIRPYVLWHTIESAMDNAHHPYWFLDCIYFQTKRLNVGNANG